MIRFFLIIVSIFLPLSSAAHDVRPSFLQITQQTDTTYEVIWKVPARGNDALAIHPQFPKHCRDLHPATQQTVTQAILTKRHIDCTDIGLHGQTIAIEGLEGSIANVLVRIVLSTQQTQTAILNATSSQLIVAGTPAWQHITIDYIVLGIEHILLGVDHLLFVLGLILLVHSRWQLIKTITAFTVAHSITLAASILGWVHVSQAPVEAIIALSILFLAVELTKPHSPPSITQRAPWVVAFIFGLLHGLGFAGALREVGLPTSDIPLALLTFNVGVELGQLIFVTGVLLIWAAIRRLLSTPLLPKLNTIVLYTMGGVSAFWCIDRIILLF